MRSVFKYPLSDEAWDAAGQNVAVRSSAMPRLIAMQHGQLTLWFEVDTEARGVARYFFVVGTGHEVRAQSAHLGSVIDGALVWHVYEWFPF